MSHYRMDIKGEIGLNEYSNIYDYFGIVDRNDKFTIIINNSNQQEIGIINSMLRSNSFCIYDEGYKNFGEYHINAYKTK